MKKVKLKQGTLAWEKARESRIGSSEVFDIVRYYSTDEELQNCGINAEDFKAEKPYTSVWALYHKIKNDGLYHKEALHPMFAEYGHAVEPYGVRVLQKGRAKKLKPGEVFINERLIASLDISGNAEEIDIRPYDFGSGKPKIGQRFVCEQKSIMPQAIKKGVPYKYIIQAQYQITMMKASFYILQFMALKEDSEFIRGKICQMSLKKRYEYLDNNMTVSHYYLKNNVHLSRLIEECIKRFFSDVDNNNEPAAYIEYDTPKNIIESIRLNTYFNDKSTHDIDLSLYAKLKSEEDEAILKRKNELQKIVDIAKENNVCRFRSPDGTTAMFVKDGSFRLREAVSI